MKDKFPKTIVSEIPNIKNHPEYVMIKLSDYNKLIHQNEKIDEILKELELIKLRLDI